MLNISIPLTLRVTSLYLLFLICQSFTAPLSEKSRQVYVQAGEGSYNHQAFNKLVQSHGLKNMQPAFSGSHKQTLERAEANNAKAFFAVSNTTLPGHWVEECIEVLQLYDIEIVHSVTLPINISLLKRKGQAVTDHPSVASHPAALKQMSQWLANERSQVIEEPSGTSAAAKKLAQNRYPANTLVAGSSTLAEVYPDLEIFQTSVQNPGKTPNTTLFVLAKIKKRDKPISLSAATDEMTRIPVPKSTFSLPTTSSQKPLLP